jgi:TonB family protein
MKRIKLTRCLHLVALLGFALSSDGRAATAGSDWLSAPKPKFPAAALKHGSEGSVKLQVVLTQDGHVASTRVLRSSGDSVLDEAAQKSVAKWQMTPTAIKSTDLTKGRTEIVEFKQQAIAGAAYPDRKAYFSSLKDVDVWMFAPFPSYPLDSRRLHHTGRAILKATTAADGRVTSVVLLKSSGHYELDQCAIKAVRLWRTHKQYGGNTYKVPIDFVMGGTRSNAPPW